MLQKASIGKTVRLVVRGLVVLNGHNYYVSGFRVPENSTSACNGPAQTVISSSIRHADPNSETVRRISYKV